MENFFGRWHPFHWNSPDTDPARVLFRRRMDPGRHQVRSPSFIKGVYRVHQALGMMGAVLLNYEKCSMIRNKFIRHSG